MMKTKIPPGGISLLILLLVSACAGTPPAQPEPDGGALSDSPLLFGRGTGDTRAEAEEAAYRDLLRKASASLLGPAASLNQRSELDRFFSEMPQPESYLIPESLEIISSDTLKGKIELAVSARIRLEEFGGELRKAGIQGGQLSDPGAPLRLADEVGREPAEAVTHEPAHVPVPGSPETSENPAEELELTGLSLSAAEEERLASILAQLTFLVLPRSSEAFPAEDAAALINRRIREYGYFAREYVMAQQLMSDGRDSYTAEVDASVSPERWAAGKMNADLLFLINPDGGKIEIEILEPLSGSRLLRRVLSVAPEWRQSLEQATGEVLTEVENLYAEKLSAGLPYELSIRNLDETDAIDDFVRELKGEVRSIGRPRVLDGALTISVGFLGGAEELESVVFAAAAETEGVDSLRLLSQQRNQLSFELGR